MFLRSPKILPLLIGPQLINNKKIEITFKIEGESESMKLFVGSKETVVEVKNRIWARVSNTTNDHFKILKLEYDGKILDDNQHLLKSINFIDHIVYCKRDPLVGTQEIVLEQRENEDIPSLIQVKQSQAIYEIKEIVSKFTKKKVFIIFDDCKIFRKSQTVEKCNLKDGDVIRVIIQKHLKLTIKCVFEESNCTTVEVKNTDPVSSITYQIAAKTNANSKDFLLLFKSQHLDPDKYLFQYNIDDKSAVKYYCLLRPDDIEMDDDPIDKGYISSLYKAKFRSTKKRIFLQRYSQNKDILENDRFGILNQLETFEMTKSNQNFVKLLGIYKNEDILYVAMNDDGEETLTQFLKRNSPVEEHIVAKWTRQIMEALRYLHKKKIIYRCLMPYEILIDEETNLKLNSFCLSKYTVRDFTLKLLKGIDSSQTLYMAPEINNNLSYAGDVYSLGVLLIRIVTGEDPEVSDNGDISYVLRNETSEELREFITSCVKENSDERRNIDKLFESDFIKKYESK